MLGSEQMRRKSQSKKFLTCHLVVVLFFKALSKNYTFPWMYIQLARAEWTACIGGLFGSIFFSCFTWKKPGIMFVLEWLKKTLVLLLMTLDQPCLVKMGVALYGYPFIIWLQLADNARETDREDLMSELEVMKKLKPHPHVIKLMGCVTESGNNIYIIM